LFGDFVPNPPAPPAEKVDPAALAAGVSTQVETAISNGVKESKEAKELEKSPGLRALMN
jgi:hypothetical protein